MWYGNHPEKTGPAKFRPFDGQPEVVWPSRFADGDRALVMRLTRRVTDPATKCAQVSSDPADWEFAWVTYSYSGGRP